MKNSNTVKATMKNSVKAGALLKSKVPRRADKSAWDAWTSDKGAIPVALIIPISILFPIGWGIHFATRNWSTDFRLDKRHRKSFTRGVELVPELH